MFQDHKIVVSVADLADGLLASITEAVALEDTTTLVKAHDHCLNAMNAVVRGQLVSATDAFDYGVMLHTIHAVRNVLMNAYTVSGVDELSGDEYGYLRDWYEARNLDLPPGVLKC
jgi:hypothetical protein